MSQSDESFVARWSRLKSQGGKESAPADAEPAAKEQAPPDLPDPSTLPEDADMKPYMGVGVPDDFKNKALKRILAADSSLLAPDPFEMHSLDYNAPGFTRVVKTALALGQSLADAAQDAPEKTPSNAAPAQSNASPEPSDIQNRKV